MSKPYFIIFSDGSQKVEYRSHAPRGGNIESVFTAPIDPLTGNVERAEWLQVEKIDHGNGKVDTVTINQALKAQIIADKLASDLQKELDNELEKENLKAAKRAAKLIKKSDLTDLESIRSAFDNLNKFVLALEKRVLDIEKEQ